MNDLLSLTEAAVRALDRDHVSHVQRHSGLDSRNVPAIPVLRLYNAFRDCDSDFSGSGAESVKSLTADAASGSVGATATNNGNEKPAHFSNSQFSLPFSKELMLDSVPLTEHRHFTKAVRLPKQNLQEITLQSLHERGRNQLFDRHSEISKAKMIVAGNNSQQFYSSVLNTNSSRLVTGSTDLKDRGSPKTDDSSTISVELAKEEHRKWMPLTEHSKYQNLSDGILDEGSDEAKYYKSYAGQEVQEFVALKDSGYFTQPVQTILARDVDSMEETNSNNNASQESPVVIRGREESDLSSHDSEYVSQPEIVTVPQRIVNVRSTVSASSSSATTGSLDGTTDGEQNPAKPFVALKDRFLKFHPVLLKQGVLATEAGSNLAELSDDVLIEQFVPDEKQRKLQEDFVKRQHGSVAVKKYIPAKVIQSSVEPVSTKPAPQVSSGSSSSGIPEVVASAAVAAVVATQNIMKSQQEELFQKIMHLESKKTLSESGRLSRSDRPLGRSDDRPAVESNQRRVDELEARLADITQKRLNELERQQHEVQNRLFAAISSHPASNNATQFHGLQSPRLDSRKASVADKLDECRPWVRFSEEQSLTDVSLVQDMEHEKTSVLDTPAPRQKRPVPTLVSRGNKLSGSDVTKGQRYPLLANTVDNLDRETKLHTRSPSRSPPRLRVVDQFQSSPPKSVADAKPLASNAAKEIQSKPVNIRTEPAPLEQYLRKPSKPLVDLSPYPEFKSLGTSRMSALVQYAEAEAVLKNVKADHSRLESNLETIERFRKNIDFGSAVNRTPHDRSIADKMRIKHVVGQRINAISKQIETEVEELMMQEKLNEAKKFIYPERDDAPGSRGYPRLGGAKSRQSGRDRKEFIVPDKENVPKKVKPKSAKLRQLNPIEDETQLQRIYGKALYHRLRSSEKPNVSKCHHNSPKSKLPRSPIKIPRIEVKGTEMAFAKTQTVSVSKAVASGQFVQDLQGKLIALAVPMSLIKQEQQLHEASRSLQKSSPKRRPPPFTVVTLEKPPQEISPMAATAAFSDRVEEEEEEETTMTEEGEMISLPGHTSPPSSYHGPSFPVTIPTMQPSPRSDVLAADIRRGDILQKQAIDWVEQELIARIISEMHRKREDDPKEEAVKLVVEAERDVSVDSVGSEDDGSVRSSVNVDTIGHGGVQLFVDAGRPVDDRLVAALVREVLVEKTSSMVGSRGFGVAEKTPIAVQTTETFHTGHGPEIDDAVSDTVYKHQEALHVIHPLISTPQSTPDPSISDSPASQTSLPSTPRSLPIAAAAAVEDRDQSAADEKDESDEEDVSFPTYEGMSNSESQKADDFPTSEERHDVHTPSSTPVRSPSAMMRTPSPSTQSEPVVLPDKKNKETQADFEPATAHQQPSSAAPAPEEPEDVVESEPSAEFEKPLPKSSPPKSEILSPVVNAVRVSPKVVEAESISVSTELSSDNHGNISEGQWILTLLSEGEVPHNIPLDEALKHRVRQHMINASRQQHSVDEDTCDNADDIEQDSASEVFPSEGEFLIPPCRLSDHKLMVKALSRPKPSADYDLVAPDFKSEALQVERSVGELRFGREVVEKMNHGDLNHETGNDLDKSNRGRYEVNRKSSGSLPFEENQLSIGEFRFDNGRGNIQGHFGQSSRQAPVMNSPFSPADRELLSPDGRNSSFFGHGDTTTAKHSTMIEVRSANGRSISPLTSAERTGKQDTVSHPLKNTSLGASNGAKAGSKGRVQAAAGRVMSTRDSGDRSQRRRPPVASAEGWLKSQQPKNLSDDVVRQSFETDISQNTSLLDSGRVESRTPDQMNIEDIMESHDYFNQSEFGSTGQSQPGVDTLKGGQPPFRSTYSLPRSVDFEQGTSTRSSLQYEITETVESKGFDDSLEGTEVSKYDDLEYRRELERLAMSDDSRHTPVKIPSTFDEGSDSEM